MNAVTVITAPFHAGTKDVRVGRGPGRLLDAGLLGRLRAGGQEVRTLIIEPVDAFEGEIGRSFEVKRRVARAVKDAVRANSFPLVLAGNCNTSVGVYSGLGDSALGVLWFDAHPDFDTPNEAISGYFDGMGVATLAGQCWHRLAATIPGFRPFDLAQLVYCGIRDFEPGQREKVAAYGIEAVYGSTDQRIDFAANLAPLLTGFPKRALIHIDLDCLDTSLGLANEYAAPGGLLADDLMACLGEALKRTQPAGLTIASFNPDLSENDQIVQAALDAAVAITQQAI